MSKIAFMFPGQGSFEAGMGKDVAEAVPEAMAVYDAGSESSGMDLKELCFNSPVEAEASKARCGCLTTSVLPRSLATRTSATSR